MNLPSYPLYRESGVKWLGEIPAHWEVRRLKFKAKARTSNVDKLTKEDEVPIRLCNYVDVYHNEEIQDGLSFMEATATAEEIERFGLKKGDVIITKDSESWDDIAVPAYVPEPMEGVVCGYHLSMVRAIENEFSGEYLFRLFCSDVLNDQFKVAANGVTRFGLPKAAIDNAIVVKPPLEEQQLIAGFLGRETARIDALIGKKRQILELLEEKRLAVITQAVTKGFDPAVPMKDSGIEWLGEVPAHWGVTILQRSITKIEQGWSPFCEERQATADEWAVLKSGCVNGGLFRENDHKALPATLEPRTDLEVQAGDILMCRASGSPDLIGSVAKVESCRPKVLFSDKTYRIHFDDRTIFPDFVVFALASKYLREQIRFSISGADGLANNIPQSAVKNYRFARPPVAEQKEISQKLKIKLFHIARVRELIDSAIKHLMEYRAALITNAVTGKIDVRGLVADQSTAA